MAIDKTTPAGQVRVIINDLDDTDLVFPNDEIAVFLTLEGGNVKRAAAQALDTIADNEALASKAFRTQDLATDGAKIADSLRKRATELRAQADRADADADGGFFTIVNPVGPRPHAPELTQHRHTWPY